MSVDINTAKANLDFIACTLHDLLSESSKLSPINGYHLAEACQCLKTVKQYLDDCDKQDEVNT